MQILFSTNGLCLSVMTWSRLSTCFALLMLLDVELLLVLILSSCISLFSFVFLAAEFYLLVSFCVLVVDDLVLVSVLSWVVIVWVSCRGSISCGCPHNCIILTDESERMSEKVTATYLTALSLLLCEESSRKECIANSRPTQKQGPEA
jgi:hypothetical protein